MTGIIKILEVLKSQNKQILEALKSQSNTLKSIDSSLRQSMDHRQIPWKQHKRIDQTPSKVVTGPWAFVESKVNSTYRVLYGQCSNSELLVDSKQNLIAIDHDKWLDDNGISSFSYEREWLEYHSISRTILCKDQRSDRSLIPQLSINGNVNVMLNSGIYSLAIRFSTDESNCYKEAAIVVGETSFSSDGYVRAEGADWDRLLNGQRQNQLPYTHGTRGEPTWMESKISEPWEDGVVLKFRIDTNKNTIIYQKGNTPKKVLSNVIAFTNNRMYPEYLKLFAYCRGLGADPVKLSIIDTEITDTNEDTAVNKNK